MPQQPELALVKDVPHAPWHSKVPGVKVKRLRDRRLDAEWRVPDDPLVAHAWPPGPHLEQQVFHHVELVHVHGVPVA